MMKYKDQMTDNRMEWKQARDELVAAIVKLDYPEEIAEFAVKELGSPKAMRRMTTYINEVQPKKVEILVDEVLAIKTEIVMWREKKAAEQANASINSIINSGMLDCE